jgi:hypothetical protein
MQKRMKRDFKIRFNLSRGANYMKWKLEYDGHVEYYDPQHTQLILLNCKLHNNRATAEKIHAGENKSVCAWVRCGGLNILHDNDIDMRKGKQLNYNPKKKPFWSCGNKNVDGKEFKTIYSNGKQLYVA